MTFVPKYKHFHVRKYISKCRRKNDSFLSPLGSSPTHHWPWSQFVLIVLRYCAKPASPKGPITMDTDMGNIDATGVGDHHSHINPAFEGDGPHHIHHIYEEILDLPVDSPDVLQHEGISTVATDGSLVQDEGMGSARFSLYLTSSPPYVYSICTWIFNICQNRYISNILPYIHDKSQIKNCHKVTSFITQMLLFLKWVHFHLIASFVSVDHKNNDIYIYPDSNIYGANMGPTWVLSAPDGPHTGPMSLLSGYVWNASDMIYVFHYLSSTVDVNPPLPLRWQYREIPFAYKSNSWGESTQNSRRNIKQSRGYIRSPSSWWNICHSDGWRRYSERKHGKFPILPVFDTTFRVCLFSPPSIIILGCFVTFQYFLEIL